jgi:hypothetical protein
LIFVAKGQEKVVEYIRIHLHLCHAHLCALGIVWSQHGRSHGRQHWRAPLSSTTLESPRRLKPSGVTPGLPRFASLLARKLICPACACAAEVHLQRLCRALCALAR